jgi:two-component system, OmpR family, osmolarity sensor histidine kinase EnvZ
MSRPLTLFTRTGVTLTAALLMFVVFCIGTMVTYIAIPLARQGSDDLAALMILSARTWIERPPAARPFLEEELLSDYDLKVSLAEKPLPCSKTPLPYLIFLEQALERRLGTPVPVRKGQQSTPWFCADIPMGGQFVRVSFPWSRIGAQPPLALILIIAAGAVVVLLTSLLLVRRITRPLARLSEATTHIGHGEILAPLPESGPRELVDLTHKFNSMAGELTELVENRTTLLAGISHDLRTPLTHMRLALEMLTPDKTDAALIERLRRDTEQMDQLIGYALELARGLEVHEAEEVDLREFIDGIIANYRRPDTVIDWEPQSYCPVSIDTMAMQRVLINLFDNAIRYGGNKPVTVRCFRDRDATVIQVLDRGEGIPESEREAVFRPLHRLETSRSRRTGGSGLGLAIARQLSDARGWSIELLLREGGGTEARLRIPVATTAP